MPQLRLSRWRAARRLFRCVRRAARLAFVLRALDGALAGASRREIAETLTSEGRVQTDLERSWRSSRVRRAVSRGRPLMNSGYRDFLV
ncbi:DUF2285 domain-containing protein [Mesorhizobium sp. B283B1A]|uniref:DNA -binding domain-containing protein n=1 Tax=Mesorhizobium TaxID=68287 RepID=UPI001CD1357C|nr:MULTISPECIES: DUF2285 domain-containing protein [Mesorhizobium]MCA0048234.1 DUF2285 domain-containing protein [Mesorhizobium sp. B283B1A]UQS64552.1 DUF2285 domain-containing protein [Mesorhizobium opportunistum]